MPYPTPSALLFPTLSRPPPLHALDSRTAPHHSLHNRLTSIHTDATFIRALSARFPSLPVIANERCGSWYVPADLKRGSVYFKSTDGHYGEWGFSLRRLNLGVLGMLGDAGGCLIVDSTRRGKHMPDALSKTIPIWCAVLNRLLFPEREDLHHLELLPQLISPSEHSQIEARLAGFVAQAKSRVKALDLDLQSLQSQLKRPMLPRWVTRTISLAEMPTAEDCNLVILCAASRMQTRGSDEDETYIQGAGDDSESWALGMTPEQFWANADSLLQESEEELPRAIGEIVSKATGGGGGSDLQLLAHGTGIHVGMFPASPSELGPADVSIFCTIDPQFEVPEAVSKRWLHLKCRTGKLGSRDLRAELRKLPDFLQSQWPWVRLVVYCQTGRDLSIGVGLAIVCLCMAENGEMGPPDAAAPQTKDTIRKRLALIMSAMPAVNPSRATINSVNAFLMKAPP